MELKLQIGTHKLHHSFPLHELFFSPRPTGRRERRRRRPDPVPGGGRSFSFPSSRPIRAYQLSRGGSKMVDAPEGKIPQLFLPEKKPRVNGETKQHPPTQAVAKVLDDDNLLREIIVRVGFPTTLVCAALVCKRWLGHASDPQVFKPFPQAPSTLPPRLLHHQVFYINKCSFLGFLEWIDVPRFVPMLPQPPELAAVIRSLERYNFGTHKIMHCQNGSVFTKRCRGAKWTHGVHRPLCAHKGMQIVPPLPSTQDRNREMFSAIVSKQEWIVLLVCVGGVYWGGRKVHGACIHVARWSLAHAYLGHMPPCSSCCPKSSARGQQYICANRQWL